ADQCRARAVEGPDHRPRLAVRLQRRRERRRNLHQLPAQEDRRPRAAPDPDGARLRVLAAARDGLGTMSIKTRLVIAISLLVTVALVIIGGVTVAVTRAQMIERVDQALASAPVTHLRGGLGPRPALGTTATTYTGRTIAVMVVDG